MKSTTNLEMDLILAELAAIRPIDAQRKYMPGTSVWCWSRFGKYEPIPYDYIRDQVLLDVKDLIPHGIKPGTPQELKSLMRRLWPQSLDSVLAKHGDSVSRQAIWFWSTGQRKIPRRVIAIARLAAST